VHYMLVLDVATSQPSVRVYALPRTRSLIPSCSTPALGNVSTEGAGVSLAPLVASLSPPCSHQARTGGKMFTFSTLPSETHRHAQSGTLPTALGSPRSIVGGQLQLWRPSSSTSVGRGDLRTHIPAGVVETLLLLGYTWTCGASSNATRHENTTEDTNDGDDDTEGGRHRTPGS
jgi:hypothetical protein